MIRKLSFVFLTGLILFAMAACGAPVEEAAPIEEEAAPVEEEEVSVALVLIPRGPVISTIFMVFQGNCAPSEPSLVFFTSRISILQSMRDRASSTDSGLMRTCIFSLLSA